MSAGDAPADGPDVRLALLEEALASYASDPDDPPAGAEDSIQAAVALVLRERGTGTELLLIRRSEHPGDPWSGHMALPGGRREERDEDLRATAVRETEEEVGVSLDSTGRALGNLPSVRPMSVELPRLSIHPFVWRVGGDVEAEPASREVAAVHWVPVAELADPGSRDTTTIRLRGRERAFPCFRVAGGQAVWGLTHRILESLLDVWPGP